MADLPATTTFSLHSEHPERLIADVCPRVEVNIEIQPASGSEQQQQEGEAERTLNLNPSYRPATSCSTMGDLHQETQRVHHARAE